MIIFKRRHYILTIDTFAVVSLSFYQQQYVFLCCCHSKQIYGVCRVKAEHRIYEIWKYKADKNAAPARNSYKTKHLFTKLHNNLSWKSLRLKGQKHSRLYPEWIISIHCTHWWGLSMKKPDICEHINQQLRKLSCGPGPGQTLSLMGGSCRAYDVQLCCL